MYITTETGVRDNVSIEQHFRLTIDTRSTTDATSTCYDNRPVSDVLAGLAEVERHGRRGWVEMAKVTTCHDMLWHVTGVRTCFQHENLFPWSGRKRYFARNLFTFKDGSAAARRPAVRQAAAPPKRINKSMVLDKHR